MAEVIVTVVTVVIVTVVTVVIVTVVTVVIVIVVIIDSSDSKRGQTSDKISLNQLKSAKTQNIPCCQRMSENTVCQRIL